MQEVKVMNLCELVGYLTAHDDIEDVLLEDEEGVLHEFEIDVKDEVFDGWDTVYPATLIIRKKQE